MTALADLQGLGFSVVHDFTSCPDLSCAENPLPFCPVKFGKSVTDREPGSPDLMIAHPVSFEALRRLR
jgi:hypothetical protein